MERGALISVYQLDLHAEPRPAGHSLNAHSSHQQLDDVVPDLHAAAHGELGVDPAGVEVATGPRVTAMISSVSHASRAALCDGRRRRHTWNPDSDTPSIV